MIKLWYVHAAIFSFLDRIHEHVGIGLIWSHRLVAIELNIIMLCIIIRYIFTQHPRIVDGRTDYNHCLDYSKEALTLPTFMNG